MFVLPITFVNHQPKFVKAVRSGQPFLFLDKALLSRMFFPGNLRLLIWRMALLMALFSLSRLGFLLFNFSYFNEIPAASIFRAFIYGLRYDCTALVIVNIPVILLHGWNDKHLYAKKFNRLLSIVFYTINIPLLLLNCIDFGLFRFAGKRATADLLKIMSFGDDLVNTGPKMLLDFWYLLLVFFFFVFLLIKGYSAIRRRSITYHQLPAWKNSIVLILILASTFIGFRGGLQFKPLNILSASQYGPGQMASLVLNSAFTVIKTVGKESIQEVHFFSDEELEQIHPVIKNFNVNGKTFRRKNVVLIILESFGKEYSGKLNSSKGYTPFLDSLMEHSLVFPNAFANGKRSIEGIPAIIAGLPALMNEPFITSPYSGAPITSLANTLKKFDYTSLFFHGGSNGTMGFDNFSKLAGFDKYFGRKEYNNDKDYDGNWGIYDEPFLLRFQKELSTVKEPFLGALFTISSHHPYSIPENYRGVFEQGTLPIHESIQYTDYSLKVFFDKSSREPWFKNTLFVITADHTALSEKSFYQGRVGMYAVPMIYYSPGDSLIGTDMHTTQQIDILPSILHYLNYPQPFFSLGSSVFDKKEKGFAVNFINGTYQWIEEDYSLIFDTLQGNQLYQFSTDSLLRQNRVNQEKVRVQEMERKLKALIQQHNNALLTNQLIAKPR